MNRPGGVPQSLRGIPSGFGAQQQQPPQQTRSVSSRLPNGKIGSNGSGWTFGSGVPLAGTSGGVQNPSRPQQQMGGNISFAQSLGGSQPTTSLDLSEFPSLSNNSQLANSGQSSLWSAAGSRNISSQGIPRTSTTPLSAQQAGQQDDLFGSNARMTPSQGSFRFGQQGSIGQAAPLPSQPGGIDEFPPLNNRSATAGDIGQDRSQNLISSLGFGSQAAGARETNQGGARIGNGLLNALSANSRPGGEARPPVGTRPQETRIAAASEDDALQKPPFREENGSSGSPLGDAAGSQSTSDPRHPLGAIGVEGSSAPKPADDQGSSPANAVQDPLRGMAAIDKWGMKGLRTLMANSPEFSAMLSGFGLDLSTLNIDLNLSELLSTQMYSLFDGLAPRPATPKFRLPECYKVTNVGPIENKITSFNEETLMWIFYSCPNDVKQQLAAIELSNRNWRWHKRQQVWLTKDDLMMPQVLSLNHERGYYIIWDTANWRKERTTREITLNYADLDNTPLAAAVGV